MLINTEQLKNHTNRHEKLPTIEKQNENKKTFKKYDGKKNAMDFCSTAVKRLFHQILFFFSFVSTAFCFL